MARDGVREHYPWILQVTLAIITALFSLFGVIGYATFGPNLCRYGEEGAVLDTTLRNGSHRW